MVWVIGLLLAVFIGGVGALGDISGVAALAAGAMLPGEAPGCTALGAPGAPVGAGAALEAELPDEAGAEGAMLLSSAFGAGAMLPGDAFGAIVAAGAPGAPVGAGEDCAMATPTDMKTAAEASNNERMCISFV
jgi:hypothetical protein